MNKLFTKIVGAFLGLTMAVGVGVAVANGSKAGPIDAASISGTTVTFTPSDFSGKGTASTGSQVTVTDKGITISASKGYGTTEFRVYSGSSFSISSSVGNITSLGFTFSGGKTGGLSTSYTNLSTDTWSRASLSSQARFSEIVVTYESSGSGSEKEVINKTIVGPSNMAMVTGDSDVDIANEVLVDSNVLDYDNGNGYTVSSNNACVTVSGTTLHAASIGEATITISKSDVETETTVTKYASAAFTVNVTIPQLNLPDMPDGDYELVTSKTDVTSGYYLIVNGTSAFKASMATLDSADNYVSATDNEGVIAASETLNANAVYFYGLGNYSFYILAHLADEDGYVYMGRNANSNGLDQSQTTQHTNTVVSVSNEGVAKIQAAGSKCFGFLSSKFRYYAESNANVKLYKKVATTPSQDVYTTTITVSPKTATVALGETIDLSATLDQDVTVTTVTWTADPNNSGVSVAQNGTVTVDANATVNSTATITATVANSSTTTISDTATITVGPKKLTGLTRTGYDAYYVGQKISDYEGGSITASWTVGEDTTIALDNANLSITLGGTAVTKDTVLTASDDQKQIQFTYQDPNYSGVSKYTSNRKVNVGQYFEVNDLVAHFAGDTSYILSTEDEGNSYLSFSYTSWGGKATDSVTVESSNEDLLVATISEHLFSNRQGTGKIGLLTDGESKGQAVVVLSLTVSGTTLTKSFVVTVRNTAPSVTPGSTTYTKIDYTAPASLTAGNYIIGANTSTGYVAMSNSSFAQPVTASSITVNSSGVITTSNLSGYVVSIGKNASNDISIKSGSNYLNFSGNNLANSTSAVYLNLSAGSNGTFRIKADSSATRALCYRVGYNFRSYSTQNITEGSTSYYDVELFIETSSGASYDDGTIVENFINAYMQPNVPQEDKGTGACKGQSGWYAVAKTHLQSDLDSNQRKEFRNTYSVYYDRMVSWGVACEENFSIDDSGAIVTTPRSGRIIASLLNDNTGISTIIIVVSAISFTTVGGYFFIKRRKEN